MKIANNYGATPMGLAAEVGNAEMIALLLEAGANPDSPDPDGMTALLRWREPATSKAAQLLVSAGARSMPGRSSAGRRR